METNKYFECQRCFYKSLKKSDMINHLNRVKKCEKQFHCFKYSDEELYNLSLIRNDKKIKNIPLKENVEKNEDKKYVCEKCNLSLTTKGNLKRHVLNYCKPSEKEKEIEKNVINNSNNNNSNNNNSNNVINNINNINIQIVNPFNDKWSTEHIDIDEKYKIFQNKYIFNNTLEKILENDINLNVLIDNEIGYVYNNNSLEKMDVKKLIRIVIEKIYDTIFEFGNEIKKNEVEQNKKIINEIVKQANIKFNDYKGNKNNFQENAKIIISDIYNDKRDRTYELLSSIVKKSDDDLRKGVEKF